MMPLGFGTDQEREVSTILGVLWIGSSWKEQSSQARLCYEMQDATLVNHILVDTVL